MLATHEARSALQLVRGVRNGLWTLDDLDRPSPTWHELETARLQSVRPDASRPPWERHDGPVMLYPGAGTRQPWRNLAREWIAAHPAEWEAMQNIEPEPIHAP